MSFICFAREEVQRGQHLKYLHLVLTLRIRLCFSFLLCPLWVELPEVSHKNMRVIMMLLFYGVHSGGK